MKTFKVTYTKKVGGEGTILVLAHNQDLAIKRANQLCFTGSDFRNAVETNEKYIKPSLQGFAGSIRQNK